MSIMHACMRLLDKTVVVTGGGDGFGRAVALELAREGANIVVTDFDGESATSTAEEIKNLGTEALALAVDVRLNGEVENMIKKALEKFKRIDILVNGASVSTVNMVVDLKEEEWDNIMDVNAKGTFICSRAVARQMIKQGRGGRIITISSMAGNGGAGQLAHYSASKAAINVFTQCLSIELAPHKIAVNAVCPGIVHVSELVQGANLLGISSEEVDEEYISYSLFNDIGKPQDVARLVRFLALEESDFMTGQILNVSDDELTMTGALTISKML